jgi:hypothetical protein
MVLVQQSGKTFLPVQHSVDSYTDSFVRDQLGILNFVVLIRASPTAGTGAQKAGRPVHPTATRHLHAQLSNFAI